MSTRRRSRRRSTSGAFFNCLTILALGGILCVVVWYTLIFTNPTTPLNPLAPAETAGPSPTPSITPIRLPATFTPEPSATPQPTTTPNPTSSPLPTSTVFSIVTPPTQNLTPTATQVFAFSVQAGNPIAIQNVTHPELACAWLGVGGQAIDSNGAPLVQLIVSLGGEFAGQQVNEITLTGSAAQFGYGPAGYEFKLADAPAASNDDLYIQLLDQNGQPLSAQVFFDTFDSCDKNLILVNFIKN